VVLESCHSYIHDLLKQLGPTNAMDPAIQQEINNFPPEAKVSPDLIKAWPLNQCFGSGFTESGSNGSRVFVTKNRRKKFTVEKKLQFAYP
jgi:hypothetical protein